MTISMLSGETILYSYYGMLISNKKEQTTDSCHEGDFQKQHAEGGRRV